MNTHINATKLAQFRREVYQIFNKRASSAMELVDAICSNPTARSVAEYSLSFCFRRGYSALYKAIAECQWREEQLARVLAPCLPKPRKRAFWLLGVDVTPQPRCFAPTLEDRGMVYQPTVVKGNKPVTIGHQYSTVVLLPEAEEQVSSSWVVPLRTRRVRTSEDKELVGAEQIDALLQDTSLPFCKQLCVEVGDTSYSKPAYLHANRHHKNLVTIARVRGNRTFYRTYTPAEGEKRLGRTPWYGDSFSLKREATWHEPDEQTTLTCTSRHGKQYRVEIQAWHNMLMRGKRKPKLLPMHRYPFTLVQIVRYDQEGNRTFKNPLWLIVVGERRHALSLSDIFQAYAKRFNIEHFFRFGKQHLHLTGFQTAEVEREEAWWQLVHLAYAQLWVARKVAQCLPRPWERNLPVMKEKQISPTLVQRDFGRIIRQMGTPATPPKPRGKAPGRRRGVKFPPRSRKKVVVKGKHKPKPT